jgi:hypothetical protein
VWKYEELYKKKWLLLWGTWVARTVFWTEKSWDMFANTLNILEKDPSVCHTVGRQKLEKDRRWKTNYKVQARVEVSKT